LGGATSGRQISTSRLGTTRPEAPEALPRIGRLRPSGPALRFDRRRSENRALVVSVEERFRRKSLRMTPLHLASSAVKRGFCRIGSKCAWAGSGLMFWSALRPRDRTTRRWVGFPRPKCTWGDVRVAPTPRAFRSRAAHPFRTVFHGRPGALTSPRRPAWRMGI
jgi:hypothetical protein